MSLPSPCMSNVRSINYTLLCSSTYDQLILERLPLHDFRQNLHTASRVSYHDALTSSPPFLNLNATATGPHVVAPTAGPVTPASENPAQPATPSAAPSRTVVPAIPPVKDMAPEPAVTETLAPTPPAAAAAAAQSHSSPRAAAGTPTRATASSPPDTVVPAAERLPEAQTAANPRRPGTGPSSVSAPEQQQSPCSGARS